MLSSSLFFLFNTMLASKILDWCLIFSSFFVLFFISMYFYFTFWMSSFTLSLDLLTECFISAIIFSIGNNSCYFYIILVYFMDRVSENTDYSLLLWSILLLLVCLSFLQAFLPFCLFWTICHVAGFPQMPGVIGCPLLVKNKALNASLGAL